MPPQPSHPSVRLRRNRTTTEALIVPRPDIDIPPMPERTVLVELRDPETGKQLRDADGAPVTREDVTEWSPHVVETWAEIWRSGMTVEYTAAELGLVRALLWAEQEVADRAQRGKPLAQALEAVTKVRKELGLTPMGRRSLNMIVAGTEAIEQRTRRHDRKTVDATVIELPVGDTPESHAEELGSLYE